MILASPARHARRTARASRLAGAPRSAARAALLGGALAALAAVTAGATGGCDRSRSATAAAAPTVTAKAAGTATAAPPTSALPGPALSAVDGGVASTAARVLDLAAIAAERQKAKTNGRVLLVHFWATWCYPCRRELPIVEKLARDLRGDSVDVLSLSLDREEQAPRVAAMLREHAPSLTPLIGRVDDADRFLAAFSTGWNGAIPALFVFDRQGTLERGIIGETDATLMASLTKELRALGRKRASTPRSTAASAQR